MAARQLSLAQAIIFFAADVSILVFFFFHCLISEVAWPIVTKHCRVR